MKPLDLWLLAWRGLTRRKVRTFLTTLGIAVAVASMVIFLSLGEGLRKVFTAELGGIGPDIQVSLNGLDRGFTHQANMPEENVVKVRKLSKELGIEQITPVVMSVRGSLDPTQSTVLYGLPADPGIQAVFTKAKVQVGRDINASDEGKKVAVIGAKAAENMQLEVGGVLNLNRKHQVKIIGVLAAESGLMDNFIFIPIKSLQKAESSEGRLSLIALKLKEPRTASAVAKEVSERLDLEAQTQADFLKFIERALVISDAVRFGVSLIALIVGGLAVANTVMMGVFERIREFGTLRALGARPAFVSQLVLTESLLLSIVGGLFGVVLGLGGIAIVNWYTLDLAGIEMAALTPRLILLALGISLLLGLLSGLFPARSASRLNITEALGRV